MMPKNLLQGIMSELHDIDHLTALRSKERVGVERTEHQEEATKRQVAEFQQEIRPLLKDFTDKRSKLGYDYERSFKESSTEEIRFMRIGHEAPNQVFAVSSDLKLYKTNAKTRNQPHIAIRELAGPSDISRDELVEILNHGLEQAAQDIPAPKPSLFNKFNKLDSKEKIGLVWRVVIWSFVGTAIGGAIAGFEGQETLFLNLGCFIGAFTGFLMWQNWRKY